MLTFVTWLWNGPSGPNFTPLYVNRLRSMLERHCDIEHELVCVTARPRCEFDEQIRIVAPPPLLPFATRCRRRMWQFSEKRRDDLGARICAIDLDVVITDNITALVNRPEPIVCWRVGYAGVYSGSFLMFNAGALDGAWRAYARDPVGYPMQTGERNASDQAMVNHWLKMSKTHVGVWTERDGLRTWFGDGYAALEHHGLGPSRPFLPPGTRIVVMGSADKAVMDEGRYAFVTDHWR